jgi:PAS domain S-box-containing protein
MIKITSTEKIVAENEDLRARLDEAEEILRAIRSGAVDAIVVPSAAGEQVFTLKDADHSYRVLIEDMNEGALTVTAEGLILYANRRFGKMLKMPLEKVIGSSIYTWMAPDGQRILQSLLRKGIDEKHHEQLVLAAGDGTQVSAYISVSHVLIDNMPDSFCLVATDLTEQKRNDASVASEKLARDLLAAANQSRLALLSMIEDQKQAEKALRRSEEKYRTLFNNAGEAIFVVQGGKAILCNPTATRLIGYSSEEIKTKPFSEFVHPDDRDLIVERHLKRMKGEEIPSIYSVRLVDRAGNIRWAENNVVVINWEGQAATLNFANDITERKRAEEAAQASLREKEILLREIHHRVKNNMQIISSLFNLQAGHIKDEDARRMLKEGQLRIRSMALVHEKLYQSHDLAKIDFAGYVRSLADHLFQFFSVEAGRIRLETDMAHVHLDINSAVPCGLLVTELITNALKHAFPGERKGVVGIRLSRREDGTVELRVADDGIGFPEAVDFRQTESFGLQIVNLLVGQLEATIELERKQGTAFTISFRELAYKLRT